MVSIKNKKAFITGASAGIGEATAKRLASLGVNLVLSARREDRLKTIKEKIIKEHRVQVEIVVMDMSNTENIRETFAKMDEKEKDIDILINNAGLAIGRDKYQETNIDESIKVLRTNCEGLLVLTRLFLPILTKKEAPHIVNIGSIAGDYAYEAGAIYCATKSFVKTFTDALRIDLMDSAIKLTNIKPGLVETEFSDVRFKGDNEKAKAPYKGLTPLSAEDIAESIEFTLTRKAHVQIAEMLILATAQGSATQAHRK